ncbi:vesicle formation at the endoplasmic reticulum [Orbilia blumenaviensis]|uniref:tripeptidyl-peptidase II n=1 Tax=Orbilia blumenaviensis TaxID=1796055 RepID=A0AAV9U3D1_9PEZI
MHISKLLLIFPAFLIGLSDAHPLTPYRTFEALPSAPRGWEEVSDKTVDLATPIKLRIHLVQQNVPQFEKALLDMSTPGHSSYGNHMSQDQIDDILRPHESTTAAVKSWLESQGFSDSLSFKNDWIVVSTTIGKAESLLQTKYKVFRNSETGKNVVRTLSYSVPQGLHSSVDLIQPTTLFGSTSAMKSTILKVEDPSVLKSSFASKVKLGGVDAACQSSITPECLANLYKYKDYKPVLSKNKLGVNGFLEQYAQNDDLSKFLKKYIPNAKNVTFACTPINGGKCTQHPSEDFTEANLDIQYTVSASNPIPNIYYSTAGRPPVIDLDPNTNEPYLEWLEYMLNLSDEEMPQTITTSYGDNEHTVPQSYAIKVCNMIGQLGARGVSVLFSSGDSGPGDDCTSKDGKKRFVPTFPATCPFVTSVGGTVGVEPEKAVSFSSGGFSNYFARPDYQSSAVDSYLSSQADATTYKNYYNASGRAFPDISAQGSRFHVFVGGYDQLVSGTSASSPAFAAVISLVNNDRICKGKKPLGFLNPWLYTTAIQSKGIVDITSGTSRGCSGSIPGAGWKATTGWDPVTGLGTPDFSVLKDL